MAEIVIELYHPELHALSDTTFRRLLAILSKKLRVIQIEEVETLVNELALPAEHERLRKSIRDRFKNKKNFADSFYIQRVTRGSTEIALLLSAVALWLLKVTIGEAVKESWLKSDLHRRIVGQLDTEVRLPRLRKLFERHLGKGEQLNRFRINQIDVKVDGTGYSVLIVLETPGDRGPKQDELIGQAFVIAEYRAPTAD